MINQKGEESEACSSKNEEMETKIITTSPSKRCFLDVNPNSDLNKYKQLLLNPIETKRFKPSEALSKVRDFLPQMKESTIKLMNDYKEKPDLVNMENVEEGEKHIELNLAYVLESDTDENSDYDDLNKETSSSDSSSESDSESNNSPSGIDSIGLGFKVKEPSGISLKIEKNSKKKKPLIKMIEVDQEDENKQE